MNKIIIGDIHGHADKLRLLLESYGYEKSGDTYEPGPYLKDIGCQVVFLGDYIDRGPHNGEVVQIVRGMVERNHALAIMGNHEFNAICYHSNHPVSGEPLRTHTEKNQDQHEAFLSEFPLGADTTKDVIEWFKTLPLYLEMESNQILTKFEVDDGQFPITEKFSNTIRAVHACWDDLQISYIDSRLGKTAVMDEAFLLEASQEGTKAYDAVEILLKGPELRLPNNAFFLDKDQNKRTNIRYTWWKKGTTYTDIALVPSDQLECIPESSVPEKLPVSVYPSEAPPVFFGHYWMTGDAQPLSPNVACLDYSAGKGGPLAACFVSEGISHLGAGRLRADQFETTDTIIDSDAGTSTYDIELFKSAWRAAQNGQQVKDSALCGCFYCESVYTTDEIDLEDDRILCSRCGVDYVIGSESGLPLTRHFLSTTHDYWFSGEEVQ